MSKNTVETKTWECDFGYAWASNIKNIMVKRKDIGFTGTW